MVVDKIKRFYFQNRRETIILFLILLLSAFLRLYKIQDYLTFLGDEGRDALVWLRMSRGKLTLIGPQTSVGNMYLGPLYYYLMFPFYILMGVIGPSIGVAIFAVATTFLLWFLGRKWLSTEIGLLAALFYSISPVAIIFSRTSWNPNVLPFFSILCFWGIWQFWRKENYRWLVFLGVFLSFAVQSHYLALILGILALAFWLVSFFSIRLTDNQKLGNFFLFTLLGILFFIFLTIAPLVWFDLRHNFLNFNAFRQFFSQKTALKFSLFPALSKIFPLWQMLVIRLIAGYQNLIGVILSYLIILLIFFRIFEPFSKKSKEGIIYSFFLFSLFFCLFFIGLYQQSIYDHYLSFLFPIVFLIFSIFLKELFQINIVGKFLSVLIFIVIIFLQIRVCPLRNSPGFQLEHTKEIAAKIFQEAEGKPFNLGMIARQNYDAGYRYFLEKWGSKLVIINPNQPETITDQLFVICEEEKCEPTTSPQAEIAFFGWSKIEKEWEFPWGVKLYKLVHYNEN